MEAAFTRTSPNWIGVIEDERNWLKEKNDIIFVRPNIAGVPLFHGDGLNFARKWCLDHGFDAMCHFEPDSLMWGRDWYMKLNQGIDWGYWVCGISNRPGHGIRPCPSLWVLEPTKHIDFNIQPKGNDVNHPRYEEVIGPGQYAEKIAGDFFTENWDTGAKLWFECAIQDKAICNGPTLDFKHLWNGSGKNIKKYTKGQFKFL